MNYEFKKDFAHRVVWQLNILVPELRKLPNTFDGAVGKKLLGKVRRVSFLAPSFTIL